MKSSLSSFELKHVVAELQVLIGAKIEKIFQQEKPKNDFLFSFHVSSLGKKFLYLTLPNALCLSSFKPSFPDMPPSFCSSLRRKISNAKVVGIAQHGFQRIVVINLTTKHGPSTLIIELFSSGNIILVDEKNTILAVLHQKVWNEKRKLLHGKTYHFPDDQVDPSTIHQKEFDALLNSSSKDSLVTFLAIDCSLGGTYAEHVLAQTDLDKSQSPSSLEDSAPLLQAIRDLFSQETTAVSTQDEVFPLPLKEGTQHATFNEAIASLLLKNLQAIETQELSHSKTESLSKFDKIIASQSNQRKGLEISAQQNQEAGELIYSKYQEIKQLLDEIRELKKTQSWVDIKEEMKKYDFLISINEHKGQVQVEFNDAS